jgi:hypothetical protein
LDCARYKLMFAARGDIRGQAPFRISGLTATYKQKVRNWRSVLGTGTPCLVKRVH